MIKDPSRSQECPLSFLGEHGGDWSLPISFEADFQNVSCLGLIILIRNGNIHPHNYQNSPFQTVFSSCRRSNKLHLVPDNIQHYLCQPAWHGGQAEEDSVPLLVRQCCARTDTGQSFSFSRRSGKAAVKLSLFSSFLSELQLKLKCMVQMVLFLYLSGWLRWTG